MLLCLSLTSCTPFDAIAKDAEEVLNDDIITIEIDKGAMREHTDIEITVKIKNSDPNASPIIHVHSPGA